MANVNEWVKFAPADVEIRFNGKIWQVRGEHFPRLVSWLLESQGEPNDTAREEAIAASFTGVQRVGAAWTEARNWAGDIATRYAIDHRFGELAAFMGVDF